MAVVIEALVERGYRIAWRVLDAQYFGVPQRRRRVFIVGCLGNKFDPAEILAFSKGEGRNFVEGNTTEQRTTSSINDGTPSNLMTFSKVRRAQNKDDWETWTERNFTNTLNLFDNTNEARATELIIQDGDVRRLTPLEMERLQGFPDHWTAYQSDSRRFQQIGNAVAVPVAQFIVNGIVNNV
jgi:DNA (cytosine-5)-methyltransferase 1